MKRESTVELLKNMHNKKTLHLDNIFYELKD
jgi:hypothetical protein